MRKRLHDGTQGWASFLAATAALCGCAAEEFPTDDVPAPVCQTIVTTTEIAFTHYVARTDAVFVVDDGPSMAEEQVTLQRELPGLVRTLINGGLPPDSPPPSHEEIHVGVVSADLGAVGIDGPLLDCTDAGDDGILHRAMDGCGDVGASFLEYVTFPALGAPPSPPSPDRFATDFACVAALGTGGCAYAQPLEAGLKALWPSVYENADGDIVEPNPILFRDERDGLGRGDRENTGFLRNDPVDGISLIGIIVVTDKDDCSARDPRAFGAVSDPTAPETRCAQGEEFLYKVDRYVTGLQGLRPGNENLVVLGAITGVPPDLVDENAQSQVDLADSAARDAYYAGILADSRMQYAPQADGTLAAACENEHARATPARRLVDTVQRFGKSGSLVSICADDWSPILRPLIDPFFGDLGAVCLPRALPWDAHGLTNCTVTWELPRPGEAPMGTPVSCDAVPNLLTLNKIHPVHERRGFVCKVNQLAVTGTGSARSVEPGYGWYLDDFSDAVRRDCATHQSRQIAFSEGAIPPTGVVVKVECHDTRYLFPASGDLARAWQRPEVFDACDPEASDSCDRPLQDADFHKVGVDRALYCHPELRQCVPACTAGACPEGWQCNSETPAWCEPLECHVPG